MTPKITPEIRKAIDEQHGKPVFVVDADRHQTFVLLTSDDFQRVEPFLGYSPDEGEWTDAKESRRRELIDKDIAGSITSDEKGELAVLDRQGNAQKYLRSLSADPQHAALFAGRAGRIYDGGNGRIFR